MSYLPINILEYMVIYVRQMYQKIIASNILLD